VVDIVEKTPDIEEEDTYLEASFVGFLYVVDERQCHSFP
jgi:hypothetical protein